MWRTCSILVVLIAGAPAQPPGDPVRDICSPDWRVRNAAAEALDRVAPGDLPVEALLAALDEVAGSPADTTTRPQDVIGIGRGRPLPPDPLKQRVPSPRDWLGWTSLMRLDPLVARSDRDAAPSGYDRLLAPFPARALIARVLARAPQESVTEKLSVLLRDRSAATRLQAGLSLAAHGEAGRAALERVIADDGLGNAIRLSAFEVLLGTPGAADRVASWAARIPPDIAANLLFPDLAANSAAAAALGRCLFSSPDIGAARHGIRLILAADPARAAFAVGLLRSDSPEEVRRALVLASHIEPTAESAADLAAAILSLVESEDPGIAAWAMQALAFLEPGDGVAVPARRLLRKRVDAEDDSDLRLAALLSLGHLPRPDGDTLSLLAKLAVQGDVLERRVAIDGLLHHGEHRILGDSLERAISMRARQHDAYAAVQAVWLSFDGADLRSFVMRRPLDYRYDLIRSMVHPDAAEAAFIAAKTDPWHESPHAFLRDVAFVALVQRCVAAGEPVPEDRLLSHSDEEHLDTRIRYLCSTNLLERVSPSQAARLLAGLPPREIGMHFRDLFSEDKERNWELIQILRKPGPLRDSIEQYPLVEVSAELSREAALALLKDADPLTSSIGLQAALRLAPRPPEAEAAVLAAIRSGIDERRRTALQLLRRSPGALPSRELVLAVQELIGDGASDSDDDDGYVFDEDLFERANAWSILLSWSR